VGRIVDDWHAKTLHALEADHIDHKRIVTEGDSPFGQPEPVLIDLRARTGFDFPDLLNNILRVPRRQKLAFLHVQAAATRQRRFRTSHDHIGLATQKSGDLHEVDPLGDRLGLIRGVEVSAEPEPRFIANSVHHLQPLHHAGPSKALDGSAIGLIKGSLEVEDDRKRR